MNLWPAYFLNAFIAAFCARSQNRMVLPWVLGSLAFPPITLLLALLPDLRTKDVEDYDHPSTPFLPPLAS
ncbi:MAG: hypothetical protein IT565_02360 [Rhodospirillales bacterium]|nr:hypothetical protein [Rhodospirillales bacterium]